MVTIKKLKINCVFLLIKTVHIANNVMSFQTLSEQPYFLTNGTSFAAPYAVAIAAHVLAITEAWYLQGEIYHLPYYCIAIFTGLHTHTSGK